MSRACPRCGGWCYEDEPLLNGTRYHTCLVCAWTGALGAGESPTPPPLRPPSTRGRPLIEFVDELLADEVPERV